MGYGAEGFIHPRFLSPLRHGLPFYRRLPIACLVDMSPSPVQDGPEGASLSVIIQPRASRTEYVGVQGEALKFRVAAPPVEGAANEALCRFLATCFRVPFSQVMIQSGAGARRKRVLIRGVTARYVRDRLNAEKE